MSEGQTGGRVESGTGVAYNGVRLDAPAPVDAILSAYSIAPFDDCGGHVNPVVGYHYHAVTDCLEGVSVAEGHGPQIGIALDGHGIFPHTMMDGSTLADLDGCNGHTTEDLGYHDHAGAAAGSNAILPCLAAQSGCASEDADAICDASVRRRP